LLLLVKKPMLDGRERSLSFWLLFHGRAVRRPAGNHRKAAYRGVLEDLPRSQDQALAMGKRDNPQAQNGVAAEFEEALIGPDPGHSESFGPDGRDLLLNVTSPRGLRRVSFLGGNIEMRKSTPINLASGGERETPDD
jgi:hypothetical protein